MSQTGAYRGWSSSGTLVSKDPLKTINLQANFVEPVAYTVQFSVTNIKAQNGSASIGSYIPTAEIVWSVTGNSVRRLVSVVNGTSVTGVGQGCRVLVRDSTPPTDISVVMAYDVSILIAPGDRAANQTQPILVPLTSGHLGRTCPGRVLVLPQTYVDVPVPENAGVIAVAVTVSGMLDVGGLVITEADAFVSHVNLFNEVKRYNPKDYEWVPIGPETTIIRMYNYFPVVSNNVLLYNVTFGIDG
jgi:hypothetical protein